MSVFTITLEYGSVLVKFFNKILWDKLKHTAFDDCALESALNIFFTRGHQVPISRNNPPTNTFQFRSCYVSVSQQNILFKPIKAQRTGVVCTLTGADNSSLSTRTQTRRYFRLSTNRWGRRGLRGRSCWWAPLWGKGRESGSEGWRRRAWSRAWPK